MGNFKCAMLQRQISAKIISNGVIAGRQDCLVKERKRDNGGNHAL